MKTRKLLSIVMAVMMLFGCLSVSASALELPAEIEVGVAKFRGLAEISSAEIPVVSEAYTGLAADAEFTVYYSVEKEENIFDVLDRKEVATLGVGDAYFADGVIHLNLKGKGLSEEGYYYITIGSGALEYKDEYTDRYNVATTTEGVQYQFESLSIGDKIATIFDFIFGMITNLISNGKTY